MVTKFLCFSMISNHLPVLALPSADSRVSLLTIPPSTFSLFEFGFPNQLLYKENSHGSHKQWRVLVGPLVANGTELDSIHLLALWS